MLFDLNLVLNFFAKSSLEEKAHLIFIDFHDFFYDLVREIMNNDLIGTFPNQNELFLEVNTNQLSISCQVKVLHSIVFGLSIEERLSIVFKQPSFNSIIGNTEVFLRLTMLNDDFFELFLSIHKRTYLFCCLFRANLYFTLTYFAVVVAVYISEEADID